MTRALSFSRGRTTITSQIIRRYNSVQPETILFIVSLQPSLKGEYKWRHKITFSNLKHLELGNWFDSDRMPNVLGLFLVAEKMGHILCNYLRWLLYLAQNLNNREGVAHKWHNIYFFVLLTLLPFVTLFNTNTYIIRHKIVYSL